MTAKPGVWARADDASARAAKIADVKRIVIVVWLIRLLKEWTVSEIPKRVGLYEEGESLAEEVW